MADAVDPVFLATLAVTGAALAERGHRVQPDVPQGRILRSVLMKPEFETTVDRLHLRVEALAARRV
jgi:hypothetical protein